MNQQVNIDPMTGMPVQYEMAPPQPSNVMGGSKPLFNQNQQANAQGVFGDPAQRQMSLGQNAPLFKKSCGKYKK